MKFGTAAGHAALRKLAVPPPSADWIQCVEGAPYFQTESGQSWAPIGCNEAITWPNLAPLYRRRDPASVEQHFARLRDNRITCIRLMLDYNQVHSRHLETRCGQFSPAMVQMWDDLIALGEAYGIRYLVTPFDTFFMTRRWKHHPYSSLRGGPCVGFDQLFTCTETRAAIKNRLAFATRRWGHSPALFGWDLWNEIDTRYARGDAAICHDFVSDISAALRKEEMALHGRCHLQTVSVFTPTLDTQPELAETVFRHPALDFANIHLYEKGTIDNPRDTLAPAMATVRLMTLAIQQSPNGRPVFDSEHGPIHAFKDRRITLPDDFDNEYFRRMQWAHLAAGGAGGGMRWPNRHPHVLTQGMYEAQKVMAEFLPLLDWVSFQRQPLDSRLVVRDFEGLATGCGDGRQAIVCLMASRQQCSLASTVELSGLEPGIYKVTQVNMVTGANEANQLQTCQDGALTVLVNASGQDMALAFVQSN